MQHPHPYGEGSTGPFAVIGPNGGNTLSGTGNETTRAAGYVRVSTDEQAKRGYSLDEQVRLIRERVERDDATLPDEHLFRDEGISGARLDRPEYQRLLATAAAGALDIVLSGYAGPLTDRQLRYVDMARQAATRMNQLVDQLLDLARAQAGSITVSTAPVQLDRLAREVIDRYRGAAATKQLTIVLGASADDISILGDPERLAQVLGNLITNAIRFAPANGVIDVQVFGPPLSEDAVGVSVHNSQLYLFVFLAAVAAGTFLGGPLGDYFGRKYVIWFSILGTVPFALLLPYANLPWTLVLAIIIGLILSSAFSAIIVYAQELVPGRTGMIAGLFFGLAFGMGGLGAAILGEIADWTSIGYVYKICSFLPLIGLVTWFLPNIEGSRSRAKASA